MGSNDVGTNINLTSYSGITPLTSQPVSLNDRQIHFGETIRKLGRHATKGEYSVWNFLSKQREIPHVQNYELVNRLRNSSIYSKTHEEIAKLNKLNDSVTKGAEVLSSARTVFPMTLFHDDIVVDRSKVTITKRQFFYMSEVMSISRDDILNVKVSLGPFFGAITIAVRILNSEDHHTINYLWRKDAVHIKHLIQGYIVAQQNKIDIADMKKDELVDCLCKLGHDTN